MFKTIALLSASLLTAPAIAAPIDGTWLASTSSAQLSAKPKVRSLVGGVYHCSSCTPAYSVPADGKFHAIKGDPYQSEILVKRVDARSVAFEYRAKGQATGSNVATVAVDGKTISWSGKSISSNGTVTTGEQTDIRVAPGPKGAHAISGTWRNGKIVAMDAKALTVSFKQTGNMLHMSAPTGESYDAPIGGKPVMIKGDASGTMASVRHPAPNTYIENDWLNGKLMSVMTVRVVTPTTLAIKMESKMNGRVTRYTATKQ